MRPTKEVHVEVNADTRHLRRRLRMARAFARIGALQSACRLVNGIEVPLTTARTRVGAFRLAARVVDGKLSVESSPVTR